MLMFGCCGVAAKMWRLRGPRVPAFSIPRFYFNSCPCHLTLTYPLFFRLFLTSGFEQPAFTHTIKQNKSNQMQIIVTAPAGDSMAFAVEDNTTIADLKLMIDNTEFIPGHLIRLMSGDSELVEGTLAGLGIEEDDELALMLEVPGGMRAKWRKKRMRRLRRKRRKMRQRAR